MQNTTTKKPRISVIMGIYNTPSKEILNKSIISILKQTYENFEFIICDDGSSNDCLKWAKEICIGDNRVKFIKNERNMGLAYTLNCCINIAQGDFIARMDDDDESILDRLKKQIEFLEHNTEIGLVSSNINLFDEERGIWGLKKYNEYIESKDFLFNSPIAHPTVMARKECYEAVSGYRDLKRTVRVEDYDCFMRMFSKGIKMYVFQNPLLNYRENSYNAKKKKYKYRINEVWVRYHGFKNLKILNIYTFIYVIKPLIAGLIPQKLIKMKNVNKKLRRG